MSEYANIPDELQNRDQWLYWNASSDAPRKPLATPAADHGASWSDPEEWVSFETAVEGAGRVSQAGIGYVNAADNPDYARGLIGSIDIDGAADADGHARDWVPSLEPFFEREAYVEWSPSGEGLRIPVIGLEVPEWWSDFDGVDGEHKGVEVLTNKFSTYTGEQLRGAGDDATEYGEWLDDWLREVYKQLAGEDPLAEADRDDDPRDYDGEDWLTEDVAEEALSHVNNNCGYQTWRDIGMALANHFGESVGGRLFKSWSRGASKWDREAERQAERIIEDASGYGYDAGTIVHHASSAGWDASAAARKAVSSRTDGGATAVAGGETGGPDGPDGGREWTLNPLDVLELACRDPMHPADYDDEGAYDLYPRDLRANERGSYVWMLAKKTGDDDVLAQRHGPILAYNPDRYIWADDDCERLRDIANEALGSAFSANVVNEIEENIRSERVKDPDELGAPDATLMTAAGLLDLREREVRPGRREHYALASIPTEPDWGADCPRWQQFLDEAIDTEHERKKFQEYCGYTLWRHAQTWGKAMLLVGPTDSGKSTALKVIRAVLGTDNVASESLQNLIETRWGKAQLVGNIANIREEVTPSGLSDIEAFKELTGGEAKVTAEYKGEQKFDFVVTQKFMFATNEVPSVQHADEAFYNRLLFVRFPNTVPPEEQDPQLTERLKAERAGILNWMLDGLDRLLDRQEFAGERSTPEKKELCDAFGGVIDRFTHNCLMITGNSDDVVSKADLHDLAHAYADDIDKEPDWGKQTGFTRQISNQRGIGQGQRRIEGEKTDVLTGVRVKPEVVYRYDMDLAAKCEDRDEPEGRGLHNYQDSDLRPGYDSREERNLVPLIVKTVREHEGDVGMAHDDLVAELVDLGADAERVEHKIEKALRRGDIHEPQSDHYRAT